MTEIEEFCNRHKWDTYVPQINERLIKSFKTRREFWEKASIDDLMFVACTSKVLSDKDVRKVCACLAECVYPYVTSMTKELCKDIMYGKEDGTKRSTMTTSTDILAKFTKSLYTGYHPWQDCLVLTLSYLVNMENPELAELTSICTDLAHKNTTGCILVPFIRKIGISSCATN